MAEIAFDFAATLPTLKRWPEMLKTFQSTVNRDYYEGETFIEMPVAGNDVVLARAEVGPLTITRYRSQARTDSYRSSQHIRRNRSDVHSIWFVVHGAIQLTQNGRETVLDTKDFAITSAMAPFRMRALPGPDGYFESYLIRVPSHVLAEYIENADNICALAFPRTGAAHLSLTIFTSLFEQMDGVPRDLCDRVTQDALSAIGTVVAAEREPKPEALVDQRLRAVLDHIHCHMSDANLSAAHVAAACRMSVRYLHHLFTHHDHTFQEHVRHVRLKRARELLESEKARSMLIAEIGYLVGFQSDAHFSRSFRAKFGLSPTDVRTGGAMCRAGDHRDRGDR